MKPCYPIVVFLLKKKMHTNCRGDSNRKRKFKENNPKHCPHVIPTTKRSQGQILKMNNLIYECTSVSPNCMAPRSDPTSLTITSSVNQLQPADLIGGLGKGLVTVAENSKADGQNTVSYGLGVRPCAGV